MAVILDIDLPEGCGSCPLNDDDWSCIVTGKPIAEYGAPMDCPLYDIPEYGKEILKAVMDERTKGLTIK